jgi:hypothetical protein
MLRKAENTVMWRIFVEERNARRMKNVAQFVLLTKY